MKLRISDKDLLLIAGILVALIIAFTSLFFRDEKGAVKTSQSQISKPLIGENKAAVEAAKKIFQKAVLSNPLR